jgi:hypothetical protein
MRAIYARDRSGPAALTWPSSRAGVWPVGLAAVPSRLACRGRSVSWEARNGGGEQKEASSVALKTSVGWPKASAGGGEQMEARATDRPTSPRGRCPAVRDGGPLPSRAPSPALPARGWSVGGVPTDGRFTAGLRAAAVCTGGLYAYTPWALQRPAIPIGPLRARAQAHCRFSWAAEESANPASPVFWISVMALKADHPAAEDQRVVVPPEVSEPARCCGRSGRSSRPPHSKMLTWRQTRFSRTLMAQER